jgi:hypothetical protein
MAQNEWVNCSVTWIKFPDGTLERWVQPKIAPAWVESNIQYQTMFQGRSVFVFKGLFDNNVSPYRFCSLLCFDWVANVEGQRVWRWIVSDLGNTALAAQAESSLTWLFVIQCNPQPSHASFLAQIESFFDQTIQPNVFRERACLVMANTAGSVRPGRVADHGATAVLHSSSAQFSAPKCSPTYSNGGVKKRGSGQLGPLRDALFREGGACIHSFFQKNPASLVPGAAGKTQAISRAFVYPIGGHEDRRTPRAGVPACIKWLNDNLDTDAKGLASRFPAEVLSNEAQAAHDKGVNALREIEAQAVETAVQLACPSSSGTADDWGTFESAAIDHILQTITVFDVADALRQIDGRPTHASIDLQGMSADVVAIRAETHEACANHLKDRAILTHRQIVAVTRDSENSDWPKGLQSFLSTPTDAGEEVKITDPDSAIHYVAYKQLLDAFRGANSKAELTGLLHVILTN